MGTLAVAELSRSRASRGDRRATARKTHRGGDPSV
jgi:hypothetical protein